jgi:hypothetical protein
MSQNGEEPLESKMIETQRFWADVDLDEQEYLDLLATFGEGYFDFTTLRDDQSGETGLSRA